MGAPLTSYCNGVQVLVLATWVYAAIKLRLNTTLHIVLFSILSLNLLNEILSAAMLYYGMRIALLNSVTVLVHHALWLTLLLRVMSTKTMSQWIVSAYLLVSPVLVVAMGVDQFSNLTFVIGALLYVLIFTVLCLRGLNDERLQFFEGGIFLLLCAPLLLFIGLSLQFGFQDRRICEYEVVEGLSLYKLVIYFVNIVYYGLISVYIRSQR